MKKHEIEQKSPLKHEIHLKSYIRHNKKQVAYILGFCLLILGLIPLIILTFHADMQNTYTIKQISLTSEDKTELQALIYTPEGGSKDSPGVVVAHGFCGNKQYMQPISIELVKRGFTVLTIDFRGHGSSDGYLNALRRKHENNPLIDDMEVAVKYLEHRGCDQIGLVGHSMGGRTALLVAEENPNRIDATVSIGMIDTGYNFSKISNLMMAIGQYEQIFSVNDGVEFLKEYTGKRNPELNELYGDFSNGDATKVIIGPFSEHLAEVLDTKIIYETVQWFEQAFNGKRANSIRLTNSLHQICFFITLSGLTLLSFLFIFQLRSILFQSGFSRPSNDHLKEKSPSKLMIYYILGTLIGAVSFLYPLSMLFLAVLPVSMGHILYGFIVSMALGFLIIYYLLIIRSNQSISMKDLQNQLILNCSNNPYRALAYSLISGLLITIAISSIMHWSTNASFLTIREIGTVIGIVILFFPFLLIKEFFFRSIQEKLNIKGRVKEYFSIVGLGVLLDNLLIVGLMVVTWQNNNENFGFIALSMTAVFIISVIIHFLLTWIYMNSGRNILGSTLFYCILYGWIIVNFFPFGINTGFI